MSRRGSPNSGVRQSGTQLRHGLGYDHNQLLKVVLGVKFTDGIEEVIRWMPVEPIMV
jgi:hypothetical protein